MAPATFQHMMDVLLRPHQQYAAAYLNDVVNHSEGCEEHLRCLREVLTMLRSAGLTTNPQKCHLGLTEARYLSFCIAKGLVLPQEEKVSAVKNVPQPCTKTQVRAFLGFAGYYRCFIPDFSSVAWPRTDLMKKSSLRKFPGLRKPREPSKV